MKDGMAIENNFKVNDVQSKVVDGGILAAPSIAVSSKSDFVIAWVDERNGNRDIYAQRYLNDGTAGGNNFKVNDDSEIANQFHPSVAYAPSGRFMITWEDLRNGDSDIYAQRYESDGTAPGHNFKVNLDTEGATQRLPSISAYVSDDFIITWYDYRNGGPDIYAQRHVFAGSRLGGDFMVNDDQGAFQRDPAIAVAGNGDFIVAWRDERNDLIGDIYAQRFSNEGIALGGNFRVNDIASSVASQRTVPCVSANRDGTFMIAWEDKRNGDDDLYAQLYLSDGTSVGNNFKVNDDAGTASQEQPSITADSSGNFIIAWTDGRDSNGGIYVQRYLAEGTAVGGNFRVNDEGSVSPSEPSMSVERSGNFIVTWRDRRTGNDDIFAQRFMSDGIAIGNNFKVNDDEGNAGQREPRISVSRDGNFIITWRDLRNGNEDIYAQRFLNDGTAVGNNFKVNDDAGSELQREPSISMDEIGNFIIVWRDKRNDDGDIYAQIYLNDGTAVGTNFRITTNGDKIQRRPDVQVWNNGVYTTWYDNRAGETGYDIWANVLEWDSVVGIDGEESHTIPTAFVLHQNYPNPFNPETDIRFQLPKASHVVLRIFNPLGQEIRTLVNRQYEAGYYSMRWDGKDDHGNVVSSGIYLYQLQAGEFSQVKKMSLLK